MSEENGQTHGQHEDEDVIHDVLPVSGLYENWFLDYASYVILERAVPALEDGFKPVQRRIMHAMKEMDDGRYNKVANIIGQTMQYHPHGDASIGDAMVNMGQKDLLIDTQGNWGDVRTGDSAAAPRYIEARLSKFALDVVFNPQTTEWQLSYDGRKKEPVTLPVKFPLLLAQGVEGIAVGLSTRILPHNFIELIKGSIDVLKGKRTKLVPDFPTGGMADFSEYNRGQRGGRIRVRARIEQFDKKTLAIKEIPFGTTTTSLIDSIIKANDKGKIKIKQVVDNTAQEVEILISLASGVSPDITIDALYAFTDCEVSISPNACVIIDDKPRFMSIDDILKINTEQTVSLLTRELEIKKHELLEKLLFSSLEKIFIENRIYRDIEECETWEAVIETIDRGLDPFKPQFYREITRDDIVRLTEIKIKRISKFDSFKADELMKKLEEELAETEYHLAHITEFAIGYFEKLMDKYGKGRERKTEIVSFENIAATVVAANNQKLYVNRSEGFVGYGLKKEEFVCECSDIDDIIAFRQDGKFMVSKIDEKVFMGKNIVHVQVFNKNDERMVYNMAYVDGKSGRTRVKRFQVLGVTRDKEYDLTKGSPKSKVLWFTANPNGEAEVITVKLSSGSRARIKVFDFDFKELDIKGRNAQGNILTKYPVRRVELKAEGVSTLEGLDIWYDETVGRLNRDERGTLIGNFNGEDRVLVLYRDGSYELTTFDLTNRYEARQVLEITKLEQGTVITAVYEDGDSKNVYLKRFQVETSTLDKRFNYISEDPGSKLFLATTQPRPVAEVSYRVKGNKKESYTEQLAELIDVKGWKAVGNKLTSKKFAGIKLVGGQTAKQETTSPEKEEAESKSSQSAKASRAQKPKGDAAAKAKAKPKDEPKAESKTSSTGQESSGKEEEGFRSGQTIDFDLKSGKNGKDQLNLF